MDDEQYKWLIRGNVIVPTGQQPTFSNDSTTTTSTSSSTSQESSEVPTDDDGVVKGGEEWIGVGYLKLLRDHIVAVSEEGIIKDIQPASDFIASASSTVVETITTLDDDAFLCPGFVDLHIHAPQYAYTGTATDRNLFEWLDHYTFPAERSLHDNLDLAKKVYDGVVNTTLSFGTTTAVYHTTLHLQPCKVLVDTALTAGQRALIGKVCMDRNSPENYRQSIEQNVDETVELIDYIHKTCGQRKNRKSDKQEDDKKATPKLPLILPMVIPRFIPTCSPTLLTKLSEVVKEYDCYFTTHISEGLEEVEYSKKCDKEDHGLERTGSEVLESHGLLTDQCILAHCTHASDSDAALLRKYGSAIAHCPLSNFFFGGGTFPCRKFVEQGNLVGLATDVAGGYSPSMLHTQRDSVLASRALNHTVSSSAIDYRQAFWLATLGGARSLGLQHKIGTLEVGFEFDAIVLSPKDSPIQIFDTDSLPDIFQKLCVLGDDRNVKRVFVQGREIGRNSRKRTRSPSSPAS